MIVLRSALKWLWVRAGLALVVTGALSILVAAVVLGSLLLSDSPSTKDLLVDTTADLNQLEPIPDARRATSKTRRAVCGADGSPVAADEVERTYLFQHTTTLSTGLEVLRDRALAEGWTPASNYVAAPPDSAMAAFEKDSKWGVSRLEFTVMRPDTKPLSAAVVVVAPLPRC